MRVNQVQHFQRWMSQPQTVRWRKVVFQVHLWSGIGIGLYVLLISITGSILVYRNELYTAASRGVDMRDSVPVGYWMVTKLLELHDDLLGGSTGRSINGIGALLIVVLAFTGIIVWWPGIRTWRRSLTVRTNVGWRRFVWDLHSMVGFWAFGFILLFGLSGAYLGNPDPFQDVAERLRPSMGDTGSRLLDDGLYWLAYLHFGRINGIGIPCSGPGFCDWATKFVWALFGLAPALMFVTGAMMWWNRVVRRKVRRLATRPGADENLAATLAASARRTD